MTFVLAAAYGLTQAQEKLSLDLDKSIDIALGNNHEFNRIKLERDIAVEKVREAYGTSVYPNVSGDVTYNRAIKRAQFIIETDMFSGSFPVGTKNTLTAGVRVDQPLFTGAMFLAVKIANTFAEISEQSVKYSDLELRANVKEAWYTCLLADEMVKLSEIQVKRARDNLKNVETMLEAGLSADYDKIKASVQYKNLLPVLTEARNQKLLAGNNLKLLLGLDLATEISFTDSLEYNHVISGSREESEELLLNNNNLLKQARLNRDLNDLAASYEFSQYYPSLNAFGTWQLQAQENDDRAMDRWRYNNSVSVGVTLKVPIFNGFATASRVEQAEIELKKSVESLAETEKSLRNSLVTLLLQITKTEEQLDAYDSAVKEAEDGYEIAVKRYKNGLGTQLEVTDALVNISGSKVNYFKALAEYYVLHARLDLITGQNGNN